MTIIARNGTTEPKKCAEGGTHIPFQHRSHCRYHIGISRLINRRSRCIIGSTNGGGGGSVRWSGRPYFCESASSTPQMFVRPSVRVRPSWACARRVLLSAENYCLSVATAASRSCSGRTAGAVGRRLSGPLSTRPRKASGARFRRGNYPSCATCSVSAPVMFEVPASSAHMILCI